MVFENKKYGIRSMNGPLSDEAAKMVAKLFEEKEDEKMTKKFTEEQYQEIVNTQEVDFPDTLMDTAANGNCFADAISEELSSFIDFNYLEDEAMALANPITRKWAHDQFVEKEKKYFWKSKNADKNGKEIFITVGPEGYPSLETDITWHALTEREIRKWGYNPDMFDKEEVE